MKKKLEAELISIAHRILKLKTKSDVRELHLETQKLYEKLSILLFVEENFADAKPTIGYYDIEKQIEAIFDQEDKNTPNTTAVIDTSIEAEEVKNEEVKPESTPIEKGNTKKTKIQAVVENELKEAPIEAIKIEDSPIENKIDDITVILDEIKPEAPTQVTNSDESEKEPDYFESIFQNIQPEPVFERIHNVTKTEESQTVNKSETVEKIEEETKTEETKEAISFSKHHEDLMAAFDKIDSNTATLNDRLKKTIDIGLNDKIAFEKNLFGGSSVDFNRVISQLSTYDSFQEAKEFIETMIKPDYNNWDGKDDYATRFMEIVESKFI
jgi:hypothetical protein